MYCWKWFWTARNVFIYNIHSVQTSEKGKYLKIRNLRRIYVVNEPILRILNSFPKTRLPSLKFNIFIFIFRDGIWNPSRYNFKKKLLTIFTHIISKICPNIPYNHWKLLNFPITGRRKTGLCIWLRRWGIQVALRVVWWFHESKLLGGNRKHSGLP